MAEKNADKCKHPGCNCTVEKGSEYCSPYCQNVLIDHLSIACGCGHTECAAVETVAAAG